jgi:hypothetical protein
VKLLVLAGVLLFAVLGILGPFELVIHTSRYTARVE